MNALLKALIPGAVLTYVVCLFMGSGGSRGGFLNIHRMTVMDVDFHWSWVLFICGTALAAAIFKSME